MGVILSVLGWNLFWERNEAFQGADADSPLTVAAVVAAGLAQQAKKAVKKAKARIRQVLDKKKGQSPKQEESGPEEEPGDGQ